MSWTCGTRHRLVKIDGNSVHGCHAIRSQGRASNRDLLPVLETYRRGFGHWRVEFSSMFEDYLAGALLLAGAWAAYRRHVSQGPILLAGWGLRN